MCLTNINKYYSNIIFIGTEIGNWYFNSDNIEMMETMSV